MKKKRKEARQSLESIAVSATPEAFLRFFGLTDVRLPQISVDTALTCTPVLAAVGFLSRTLAGIPLHAYRRTKDGAERLTGKFATVIHENPNPGMSSFKFRQWFWQQVFTGGRGLALVERIGPNVEAIWPMDPRLVQIKRDGFDLVYTFDGKTYPAADVIDVPFMLKPDQVGHYGPIRLAASAIQLALAMEKYGANFFAGGGVPPLALTGPLPTGAEAMRRAMADVYRVIDTARQSDKPIFPMPPGHDLKPVGFDPAKGQMTEARRMQTEEIARAFQLPPVFLQDLSRATFSNAEQQDLHLVKHLVSQWCAALEGEMNLKVFGRLNGSRYVEHNIDGLLRGDFKSRMEGLARGFQAAMLTPNEMRALENRAAHTNPYANDLFVQGATVPLGSQPGASAEGPSNGADDGTTGDDAGA